MPGFARGIIFWKRKDFMMAKNKNLSIAFYERYLLTVEEAAAYFHIGYKKMRNMVKDYDGAKWIITYPLMQVEKASFERAIFVLK